MIPYSTQTIEDEDIDDLFKAKDKVPLAAQRYIWRAEDFMAKSREADNEAVVNALQQKKQSKLGKSTKQHSQNQLKPKIQFSNQ